MWLIFILRDISHQLTLKLEIEIRLNFYSTFSSLLMNKANQLTSQFPFSGVGRSNWKSESLSYAPASQARKLPAAMVP